MAKKYSADEELSNVSKHLFITPGWMPAPKYYEYQKERLAKAREERLEENQKSERHNAFIENAKKYRIPIAKKKKKKK